MPPAKHNPKVWTEDQKMLIELVKSYPCLYAKNRKISLSSIDAIWQSISTKMGTTPPEECRRQWRYIRHGYTNSLKKKSTATKYSDGLLSFLKPELKLQKDAEKKESKVIVNQIMLKKILEGKNNPEFDEAIRKSVASKLNLRKFKVFTAISSNESKRNYIKISQCITASKNNGGKSVASENDVKFMPESDEELENQVNTFVETHEDSTHSDSINFDNVESKNIHTETNDLAQLQKVQTVNFTHRLNSELDLTSNIITGVLGDSNNIAGENFAKNLPEDNLATFDRKDIKNYFRNISQYVSTRLSLEKQKELRVRIRELMAKEELEYFAGDIKS